MKFQKENEWYQDRVNQVYGINIIVIERYINSKAAILQSCSNCGEFYAKLYDLTNKPPQKLLCFTILGDNHNFRNDYVKPS